jgi:membrane-associated phospholipid phosphatase
MNTDYSIARVVSLRALFFVVVLIFASNVLAQTPPTAGRPLPQPTPSQEKKFFLNILNDQRAIWTSPFHLHKSDAKWLAPVGLSTIALIATDRHTSGSLVAHGDNRTRLRISKDVSQGGSLYATGGTAAVFYLVGRATHNARAREAGLLGAEALVDSWIVVQALKAVSQRPRPPVDHSSGEFFDGGASFPSGHAISAWSLATVIDQEYGQHRPLVRVAVYGLATAVSLSRYTGRNHFLSDVLVGSALGYGIGRYVYHKHHDVALDALNEKQRDENNPGSPRGQPAWGGSGLSRSKLFPRIAPIYSPRAHVYGAMMAWSF